MTQSQTKNLSGFLAHSRNGKERPGLAETMLDHTSAVRDRATRYARFLGLENDAVLAALLHDLGKYTDRFKQRLRGELPGLDHSSAGAYCALFYYSIQGLAASLAIQGHHIGLPRASGTLDCLKGELLTQLKAANSTGSNVGEMIGHLKADGLMLPHRASFRSAISFFQETHASAMLDVRMLFSALVDADFIETEAHFQGDAQCPRRPRAEGLALDAASKLELVLEAVRRRQKEVKVTQAVLKMREQLQADCLRAADRPPGLFTLTAPTGSGKTLSMLAFALSHAAKHGLRRIVIVIPFLSIIEQTTKIVREIFKDLDELVVLEDHSATPFFDKNKGEDNEIEKHRLRNLFTENWDAPVVITTSINALESLHAHDPRRSRKLHHLAKSVILFDEVQALPSHLAEITLGTLSRLASRYDSTVVLSTATQPAFEYFENKQHSKKLFSLDWSPNEIVRDVPSLFSVASGRYNVSWRINKPIGWEELSLEILQEAKDKPVLAIVNLKPHAVELIGKLRSLDENRKLLHLSTSMCPSHRKRVLKEAEDLMDKGEPFVFVSTQCIEAGVDISAPVVFRAFAPLEAIAQAAGRCNRHGTDPTIGQVIVFIPEDEEYPPGAYETAASHTKAYLKSLSTRGIDIESRNILSDPSLLKGYYQNLYASRIQEDEVYQKLKQALEGKDFPEVSKLYRLITSRTVNILVPYDDEAYRRLVEGVSGDGNISREWVREARSQAVSIPLTKALDPKTTGLRPLLPSDEWHEAEWFILQEMYSGELYDKELLGLRGLSPMTII